MSAHALFRDMFQRYTPAWLRDRSRSVVGLSAGYRFLYSMIEALDDQAQVMLEGLQASWPGVGTPSALPLIGKSRGIVRGVSETDESYGARLQTWLDSWAGAGGAESIALQLHGYIAGGPKVRVISRLGRCVTCDTSGAVTRQLVPQSFWDYVSHPERFNRWWDEWIIIYPDQWSHSPDTIGTGTIGGDLGWGHDVTRAENDAIRAIVDTWKAAHSHVVAIIWCNDNSLFDPANPGTTWLDGTCGGWSGRGSGARHASARNNSNLRIWEM